LMAAGRLLTPTRIREAVIDTISLELLPEIPSTRGELDAKPDLCNLPLSVSTK
jgi:hypothetical protein